MGFAQNPRLGRNFTMGRINKQRRTKLLSELDIPPVSLQESGTPIPEQLRGEATRHHPEFVQRVSGELTRIPAHGYLSRRPLSSKQENPELLGRPGIYFDCVCFFACEAL